MISARYGLVPALLLLSVACTIRESPRLRCPPPRPVAPSPPAAEAFQADFPPVTGPARICTDVDKPLSWMLAAPPPLSRYVLYDAGRFALRFGNGHKYPGTYREVDGESPLPGSGGARDGLAPAS